MPQDYNQTLHLPKTDFEMRANLPKREPDAIAKSIENKLYEKLMDKNKNKPTYILHDGPPYANGDIHMGHALNKILKDIIVKQKNMAGYKSPYVPGWDTHGLPIELKALKNSDVDVNKITPVQLREKCREFAKSFVENQKNQFMRLGVIGDYDNPYLTLKSEFEAKQIEIFGEMAKKDFIYKGLKPVYWCPECQTALAEAEIEYEEDPCYSIFVKFNVVDDKGIFTNMGLDLKDVYFVIWTTTTWTLPGNVAICLGPNYEYTLVKANGEYYVMAKDLVKSAMEAGSVTEYETVGTFLGSDLERCVAQHPFLDRKSLVIVGDHVTLESGTGCVHTAPGHGVEDFEVCKYYDELEIVVPVDNKGNLTELAGEFAGLKTDDANKAIAKKLEETGNLFAIQKIIHQYPHCWRCKSPILFRATEQWFCSVDDFKDDAVKAIESVKWNPTWGEERIKNMVRDRSDWCISRQRIWGVPIPILYCKDCGKVIINETSIKAISELFRTKGSDSWYTLDPSEFLPSDFACECGCKSFDKEKDIMDVWFDSGVTHAAVLCERDDLTWPADLYLEGNDQYRGWFQSSLLTSVAWKGVAPYKAVFTHGMVVDGEGKKMSKSLGNGMSPLDICDEYGSDILRLWVSSLDYRTDIRISKEILKQTAENYRKIRNTARYILGNLNGFDPNKDMVAFDDLTELDKWAMYKLNDLITRVEAAYETSEFHVVSSNIHKFCVVDMSNFYLDIIKDRLYCEEENGILRKAAQTTMYKILSVLTRMLAPVLSFTAEEIWASMPHVAADDTESVFFNEMEKELSIAPSAEFTAKWDKIYDIREDVKKALEIKRTDKEIKASLEAKVVLHCDDALYSFVSENTNELSTIFIVSQVDAVNDTNGEFKGDMEGLSVSVVKAQGEKCERCWIYSETVGTVSEHPTICARCARVLENE